MVLIIKRGLLTKRRFIEIRNSILLSLATGQKTINQISSETSINWRTVERHLTYLMGKRWVREAFSSAYVRIFELTAFGSDYLRKHVSKNITISENKIVRIDGEE